MVTSPRLPLLALALVALGCGGCATTAARPAHSGASASGQPDMRLPDIHGEEVRFGRADPKDVIVLTFWATWCQPCQSELDKLDRVYRARAERGLHVYAISVDGPDSIAQVTSWARREDYAFPVLLDQETEILGRYNPKGDIPYYVVLDGRGDVLKSHQGYVDGDMEALANYLDGVLPAGD